MKFLLTNDDGVEADGLLTLADLLGRRGDVVVVAPNRENSGCSHVVTVDRPLQLRELRPAWYSLDCTPADCVRVAMSHLALDVDWVVSGINAGGNLGVDVFMSGTVAAAREATLFGRRAIAISHYRASRNPIDWTRAARWAEAVIERVMAAPHEPGTYWNINLPDPPQATPDLMPPMIECPLDVNPLSFRYEPTVDGLLYLGRYQDRRTESDCDVTLCFGGAITLTRIGLP